MRRFSSRIGPTNEETSSQRSIASKSNSLSFGRSKETTVTGAKKSWQAIEVGDRVSVSWKMVDVPRVAYKVVVMPPKQKSNE